MVSGFFTSPCDQSRIFWGEASLIRIASNVMGFAGRSVSIRCLLCSGVREAGSDRGWPARGTRGSGSPVHSVRCAACASSASSRRLLSIFGHELDVESQALELLDQHVERLRRAGLEEVLALDDGLVDPVATLHVVRLDGEHLLQGVGGPIGLQ